MVKNQSPRLTGAAFFDRFTGCVAYTRRSRFSSAAPALTSTVDVTVSWGEATAYDMSADRKAIACEAEKSVRRTTVAAQRAAAPSASAPAFEQVHPLPQLA